VGTAHLILLAYAVCSRQSLEIVVGVPVQLVGHSNSVPELKCGCP
jgi:hypothetical protein